MTAEPIGISSMPSVAGTANRIMVFQAFPSVSRGMRGEAMSRCREYSRRSATMPHTACEITVASAAPAIPMTGKPHQPKINSGSSSTFRPSPNSMSMLAVKESPAAISKSLPAMPSVPVKLPKYQISIY